MGREIVEGGGKRGIVMRTQKERARKREKIFFFVMRNL